MSDNPTGSVVVTVDDDHLDDIETIATELRRKGMTVSHVLPITGVVTGTIDKDALNAMLAIAGVKAIEDEGEMRAV